MRNVLRLWFVATAAFLAGAFIWAFVPVLVPLIGITAGLGILVAAIVWLARLLEAARGGPRGPPID